MFGSTSSPHPERHASYIRLSYLLLLGGCFLAVMGTLLAVDPAPRKATRKNLVVKDGPAYGKRITLRSLDLSRAPTDDELKQAGQLGGALSPEPSLEGTTRKTFSGAERRQRKEADNLLFGRAMQKWNEHHYQEAVTLFKQHRKEFTQSQWSGEVELHSGCEAQFNGRWNEAAFAFDWILNNTPKGTDIYQKARLRRSVLHMEQGELKKAIDGFAEMLQTETDWNRKTYAQSWIQQLSQMQKHLQAIRTCGSESVAYVLKTQGKKKQSEKAARALAKSEDGFTMGQLTEFANKMGLKAQAVSTRPVELAILPKPFIAHYRDQHFVVVKEVLPTGQVRVYDPRLRRHTLLTSDQFTQQWSGLAVIFGQRPDNIRLATAQQLKFEMGGCCGIAKCKGCGLTEWSVNIVGMNLYLSDVPLWYAPAKGPIVQFELAYDNQAASLSLTPFGNKWAFNYSSYAMENPGKDVLIVNPSGVFDSYIPDGLGGYKPPTRSSNKLTKMGAYTFDLETPDGTVYHYGVPAAMGAGGTSSLLLSITDRTGQSLIITHNSIGQIVTITDAMGQESDVTYNSNGFISRIDDPFGRFCTFTYDASGNLIGQTDMAGISYSYTYDANVYITSITSPKGTTQFYIEPSDGIRNGSNPYPAPGAAMWANYRITITHPDNNKEEYYYNGYSGYAWHRDKIQYKSSLYPLSAPKTEYHFHRNSLGEGAISQVRYADGTSTYHNNFNAKHQPQLVTDANGHSNQMAYNDQGRVTAVTNALSRSTLYSYATNGWDLTSVTNQLGKRVALVTYTDKRQVATVTDALGTVTAYGYNTYGQLTAVTNALGTSVQRVSTLEYNPTTARPERVKVAGATVATYTYDAIGRVCTVTDANNYTVRYAYDGLNRLIRTTYPDGTSDQSFYSCCYLEKTIDRQGRTTSYLYDKAGHLVYTRDPANRITQYERDLAGNLTKLIDANGRVTKFTYDARYRVTRKTYADGRYDTYGYDAVGNTLTYSAGLGGTDSATTVYAYDDINRLLDVTYSGSITPAVHLAYDDIHPETTTPRVQMTTAGQGTISYYYDDANRLTSVDGQLANDLIVYNYDDLNRLTGRTINSTGNVTVQYDTLGRVSTVSNPLGSFGYTYSGNSSRLTDVTNPNGQHTTYSYLPDSGDQRLSQILNQTVGNATLSQFNYGYDQGGQITQWTQQVETGPAQAYSFAYDSADSLIRATLVNTATPSVPVKDYAYTYDKGDNRTGEQIDGVPRGATYNNVNQLTSRTAGGTGPLPVVGTATSATAVTVNGKNIAVDANGNFATTIDAVTGTNSFTVSATDASNNTRSVLYISTVSSSVAPAESFTYDSRGNMLTGNGRSYAWDAANRLKTITYSDGTTTEFTYDGYGRRIKIEEKNAGGIPTSTKLFVWDGLQIAEERDGINNTVTKQFFAQGQRDVPNAANYYYTRDHLGSIRELVDANGRTAAGYDYDPYGRQGSTSAPPAAGLQVWLKADSLGLADGTPVSQWTDQSGNGLHATQTNTTSQPIYKTNQLNGKPVLRFDGSSSFLQFVSGFDNYSEGLTIFVVAKPAGTNIWERFVEFSNGMESDNIIFGRRSSDTCVFGELWNNNTRPPQVATPFGTMPAGQARLFSCHYNPATSLIQINVDGQPQALGTTGTPRILTRTQNYVAKSVWPGDAYYYGDMAEIIIYNRKLTPAERTRVETYLAQKYALPASGSQPPASDFGYTGHYTHQKSGLVLAPFRAYDPDLGRWLSRDPIKERGGINLYGYVENDSINLKDFLGYSPGRYIGKRFLKQRGYSDKAANSLMDAGQEYGWIGPATLFSMVAAAQGTFWIADALGSPLLNKLLDDSCDNKGSSGNAPNNPYDGVWAPYTPEQQKEIQKSREVSPKREQELREKGLLPLDEAGELWFPTDVPGWVDPGPGGGMQPSPGGLGSGYNPPPSSK